MGRSRRLSDKLGEKILFCGTRRRRSGIHSVALQSYTRPWSGHRRPPWLLLPMPCTVLNCSNELEYMTQINYHNNKPMWGLKYALHLQFWEKENGFNIMSFTLCSTERVKHAPQQDHRSVSNRTRPRKFLLGRYRQPLLTRTAITNGTVEPICQSTRSPVVIENIRCVHLMTCERLMKIINWFATFFFEARALQSRTIWWSNAICSESSLTPNL